LWQIPTVALTFPIEFPFGLRLTSSTDLMMRTFHEDLGSMKFRHARIPLLPVVRRDVRFLHGGRRADAG
jgi:hypothetical protein